jgi:diguanylate cyclase (GGDEF)-like protein
MGTDDTTQDQGTSPEPHDAADGPQSAVGEADATAEPQAAAESAAATESEGAAEQRSQLGRRVAAATAALGCLLAGVGLSLLVASSLADGQVRHARNDFRGSAMEVSIASSLNGAVHRERDLAVAASSFLAGNPRLTSADLQAWARSVGIPRGYPALRRLALIRRSHRQPSLCLASAEALIPPAVPAPAGRNYCAIDTRLLSSRTSGTTITKLFPAAGTVETLTPLYRGAAAPTTSSARGASFVGWMRQVVNQRAMMRIALAGHPGYAAQLRSSSGRVLRLSAGSAEPGGQSAGIRLFGNLRLRVFGPSAARPLLGSGRIWVLLAGVLIGGLLGLLILFVGWIRRPEPEPEVIAAQPITPTPEPPPPAEALYDPLTGLPGRALTFDRAAGMLARAEREAGLLTGALLIDVDWFKDVNDKLGTPAGDEVLKIVAGRLEATMRVQDTVGRLGEDQFLVLVECAARSVRPDALAQRVIEILHEPIELPGFGPSFHMTASIGIAFGRYETPAHLLRDAQDALSSAKAAGKDRYTLFNANTRTVIEGRGTLEAELNSALAERQLFLVFEPICDLRAARVTGFEAQPRWRHPERGVLPPAEFIPLAEDSGLAVPIDRFVLEQACSSAAAWEAQGRRLGVGVRLSAGQLSRDGLVTDVRRALQQSGLAPALLTLEVPEAAVMGNIDAAAARLAELSALGVRLAIDDFGDSGYAYHSDLKRLPLHRLRVDMAMLAGAGDLGYRNWLFQSILIAGRELSLEVIAKGVQSQEQLGPLRSIGCEIAQGSFLGEAVSVETVESLFDARFSVPDFVAASEAPIEQPALSGGA